MFDFINNKYSKLYLTAIITTPIIAFYGTIPFYIFNKLTAQDFILFLGGLTMNIFINWGVLLFFNIKFPKLNTIVLFLITYLSNLVFRVIILILINFFNLPKPPFDNSTILYPILTSFAINALIVAILKSHNTSMEKAAIEQKLQELKLQNTTAQKQVLVQQLQPHFLFNSLSTLKALISENQDRAENYVIKLSEFLRYSVQSSNIELIEVEKELKFVNDYILLQKERYEESFTFQIDLQPEIINKKIPILGLQVLVENIFKHSFFTKQKPLHFNIFSDNEYIIVKNIKTSVKVTERTQTGLLNLNKRCMLIVSKPIIIEDGETDFIVKLPIIN